MYSFTPLILSGSRGKFALTDAHGAGDTNPAGLVTAAAEASLCQTDAMTPDCVFCRIVAGQAPAYVVAEDDLSMAFLDRGQAAAGHTLVVPRTHASDIWEISWPNLTAVMVMAKQVAHLLDERLSPDGLNLTQSNRAAGWQDVFHFHVHVIPRWIGDGLTPPWKASTPSEAELAATLARLK
jgi:histidine triad (HIT) family protein